MKNFNLLKNRTYTTIFTLKFSIRKLEKNYFKLFAILLLNLIRDSLDLSIMLNFVSLKVD